METDRQPRRGAARTQAGGEQRPVLFVFPYPSGTAASQRFRFEQYLGFLTEAGIRYDLAPFLDQATWGILYQPGGAGRKALGIAAGFLRRLRLLGRLHRYGVVFIHREAAPLGPPVFEWIVARVFRKRVVFDFDDAVWLPNTSAHNRLAARFKWHRKTASLCRWAWKVTAGNEYLARYAAAQTQPETGAVVLLPTTIDTARLHNRVKEQDTPRLVVGWTGTHSTIGYLEPLVPVLRALEAEIAFTFLVISDRQPDFALKSLEYRPWSKATEADDLLRMNIGVMPLTDDPWSRGKCGFKALQYMALGMAAVASPVGVNTEIIRHGQNGLLCADPADWHRCLRQLLLDAALRTRLGRAARHTVEQRYSVAANRRVFLDLFTA